MSQARESEVIKSKMVILERRVQVIVFFFTSFLYTVRPFDAVCSPPLISRVCHPSYLSSVFIAFAMAVSVKTDIKSQSESEKSGRIREIKRREDYRVNGISFLGTCRQSYFCALNVGYLIFAW